MAITRGTTTSDNKISASTASGDFAHTVDTGTDLLLLGICIEAGEAVSGTPQWDRDGTPQNMVLIRDTGSTGNNKDVRVYVYGLVSPNVGADNFDITFQSTVNPAWCVAVNYSGVDTASVAAATNFISDDVNELASSTTTVLTQAGELDTFLVAAFQGNDGDPASNDRSMTEIYDTDTGTSSTADFSVYCAEKLAAALGGTVTVTWATQDQNTGVLIELVEAANVQQEHYRFATPITGAAHEAWTLVGTEDTSHEITLDDDYALIVKLGNDGGSTTTASWQLEYNVDGGGWNDVNASSSNVRTVASGDTDAANSFTERLTSTARTFNVSALDEVDGVVLLALDRDEDNELYYAITFRSADLSGGESITFRITDNSGAAYGVTYDITPTATVPAADVTRAPAEVDLTLAGKVPTLFHEYYRTPGREELSLSGKAPTLFLEEYVTPDREQLALTGKVPTLFLEEYVVPDREQLALAGKVPSAEEDFVRDPSEETLALTGKAPTVTISLVIIIEEGTLSIAGKAPSVELSYWIESPIEELDITGQVPVHITNFIRGPPIEELDLQGKVPTAGISYAIPVTEVALSLAGKVPTVFRQDYVVPGEETLALAGQAPSAEEDFVRDPGEETLTLAGQAPIVTISLIRAPGEETLALVGQVPLSNETHVRDPGEETLTIAGQAPTVFLEEYVVPGEETLTLAGQTPSAEEDFVRAPGENTKILAGKVPTVISQDAVSPPEETLVLIGKVPSSEQDFVRDPGEETLTLAGQAPTVFIQEYVLPGEETLTLAGQAPSAEQDFVRDPSEGTLVLTGKAPSIVSVDTIVPPEADLVIAGQAPSAEQDFVRDPGEETLTIAGQAPTLDLTITIGIPGVEQLVLAGQAPTVVTDASHVALPGAGSVTLAGKVPIVDIPATGPVVEVPVLKLRLVTFRGLQLLGYPPTVTVGSAGSPIETPAAGAVTLAGQAPIVDIDYVVPVGEATLALAGYAPSTGATVLAQPGAGGLFLTGDAPLLEPKVIISPPSITLELIGYDTTRAYGFQLVGHVPLSIPTGQATPLVGTLTLAGQTPIAVNTTPIPVIVSPGVTPRILTGFSFPQGIAALDPEETFILEGWEPIVTASSPVFFPSVGSLTFNVQAPISDVDNQPPEGVLVLAGQAPSLDAHTLPVTAETLTLTGGTPLVFTQPIVTVPEGLLTLEGQSAFTVRTETPGEVTLVLTGQAPTVVVGIGHTALPGSVAITLAGQTPIADIGLSPLVPAGSLTLAGVAPIVDQDIVIQLDALPLMLAGQAPLTLLNLPKEAARVELILFSKKPKVRIKRIRRRGSRRRIICLTTRRRIELLYR